MAEFKTEINGIVIKSSRPIDTTGVTQFKPSKRKKVMKTNGPKVKRIRFERIDFDEDAKEKLKTGSSFLITNPEGVTNKGIRTKDGMYSPYFGATMIKSNTVPYACECGRTSSAMKEGDICPYCDTPVQYITTNIKKNAFISISPFKILTYHGYSVITSFLKKKKMSLEKNRNIGLSGKVIKEEGELTMLDIYDYYEQHEEQIGLPIKYAFTSYIPVINATLRPLIQDNAKMRQYEINKYYTLLLNASLSLKVMHQFKNENEVNSILYEIQECSNAINEIIVNELSGKSGDIRKHFTTCRMDWSSRMVIVPGKGLRSNEVDIPYPTIVKFYEEELVQILHKEIGYDKATAMDIFLKSQASMSPQMERALEILLKDERWLFINRNPTIKFGSIVYMKIRTYNKDINDLTLKIPPAIRPIMNADHDGDQLTGVCNKLVSDSEYSPHNTFKYVYSPEYMFVDSATGYVNKAMMFTKDHAVILTELLNFDAMVDDMLYDGDLAINSDEKYMVENSYEYLAHVGELQGSYESNNRVLTPVIETYLEEKNYPSE